MQTRVYRGHDLMISEGVDSVAHVVTADTRKPLAAFAAASSSSLRYNSGSYIDADGFPFLAGLAMGHSFSASRLILGIFVETGESNYDSHNTFNHAITVRGSGDTFYTGGGILGRYALNSGLYMDASARAGRAKMDFSTGDIRYNFNRVNARFDSASRYYGAHVGVGFARALDDRTQLDVAGRLIWSRQVADTVQVDIDRMEFDAVNSLRSTLGGRFSYQVNEVFSPYAGLWWEHEFDVEAGSRVNGVRVDAPDLKGDTGIVELGLRVTPESLKGFSLDVGIKGHTGKREGVAGNLNMKWMF